MTPPPKVTNNAATAHDPRPMIPMLLIAAKEFEATAKNYFALAYPAIPIEYVRTFDEVYRKIDQYSEIRTLIVYVHGSDSSLEIDGTQRTPKQFIDEATAAMLVVPKILRIRFESCNIGKNATGLFAIKDFFRSTEITAWTNYHLFNGMEMPVNPNATWLHDDFFYNYGDYLHKNSSSEAILLAATKKQWVYWEWWREDFITDPLPPRTAPVMDSREKVFKPRSSAEEKVIRTLEEAQTFEAEFKSPVHLLYHVKFVDP